MITAMVQFKLPQPVTLEKAKEIFLEHGGERFSFIPCLNDSDGGIRVLVHLIEQELKGWAD